MIARRAVNDQTASTPSSPTLAGYENVPVDDHSTPSHTSRPNELQMGEVARGLLGSVGRREGEKERLGSVGRLEDFVGFDLDPRSERS